MALLDFNWAVTAPVMQTLRSLFRRPARLQIAALCYRMRNGGPEVLLVTSRTSRRWIFPKGWPILDRDASWTAQTEAYEEAGVVGAVENKPFASFMSYKGYKGGLKLRTEVLVFRIQAEDFLEDFPEAGQRQIAWLPLDDAITRADEAGAQRVLRRFRDECLAA